MAKGKGAVALFEVIHKDKRFDRKTSEPAQKSPVKVSADLAAHAVDLWRKRHSDPETWTNSPPKVRKPRKPLSAYIAPLKDACRSAFARSAKSAGILRAWIIRQNSAVFGALTAVLVIGLLLTVRHLYHPAAQPIPIEQALRNGPPHPSVLAIPSNVQVSPTPDSLSPEMLADVQQASSKTPPSAVTSNLLAQPGARIVNMHYVLMQSYFEEKDAIDARDYLSKNGIPCTIERHVKGWRPDLYLVVGLQGFARASGSEYLKYRNSIIELGAKFSKSKFKRFQPQAIKW